MPEFLVHATIAFPPGFPERRVNELLQQESEEAQQYFDAGLFVRVWRLPGSRDHWALWDAPDVETVHLAYASFPLFKASFLHAEVIPLAVNPNDPVWQAQQELEAMTLPLTWAALHGWLMQNGKYSGQHGEGLTAALADGVSIHDHPDSGRPRELHFMVGGQKIAEIGPVSAPYNDLANDEPPFGKAEDVEPGYVDFLAEWAGKPVRHEAWKRRIMEDNGLTHDSYDSAVAGLRVGIKA